MIQIVCGLLVLSTFAGCLSTTEGGPRTALANVDGIADFLGDEKEDPYVLWIRGMELADTDPDAPDGRAVHWSYGVYHAETNEIHELSINQDGTWDDLVVASGVALLGWPRIQTDRVMDTDDVVAIATSATASWSSDGWHSRHYWLLVESDSPIWHIIDYDRGGEITRNVQRIHAETGTVLNVSEDERGFDLPSAVDAMLAALPDYSLWQAVEAVSFESEMPPYRPFGVSEAWHYPISTPDAAWGDGASASWTIKFHDFDGGMSVYGTVRWDGAVVLSPHFAVNAETIGEDFYPSGVELRLAPLKNVTVHTEPPHRQGFSYGVTWTGSTYAIWGGPLRAPMDDVAEPVDES